MDVDIDISHISEEEQRELIYRNLSERQKRAFVEEKARADRLMKRLKEVRERAIATNDDALVALVNQIEVTESLGKDFPHVAVGTLVCKDHRGLFKSGRKVNTVSGYCFNPATGRPAYLFEEDESCVEARMCRAVTDEELAGVFAAEPAVLKRMGKA